VVAAATWTESKEHNKSLEKAVWLACLSQQVAKMERKISMLEKEAEKAGASAESSARAEEQLYEELDQVTQCSSRARETHRCEMEFLQCQVVEAKEREREAQESLAECTRQYRKLRGKFQDIQAAYRVSCAEVSNCRHGPCEGLKSWRGLCLGTGDRYTW